MKTMRKIIEIDEERCDGCGECVPNCAEGALQIIDGKAKVVSDNLCDGLGACLGECPKGALTVVEREADEFDEEAVEKHLSDLPAAPTIEKPADIPCGCPSANIQTFGTADSCREANRPVTMETAQSALTHWPIQIRLIPPEAPFLKGADLLVLADCCGVAYAGLHEDLLKGRVIMIGCPKFDDVQDYIDRFTAIFKTADIKSVSVVVMEVPCCSGLPVIVKKGMEAAGKTVPLREIVIGLKGQVLSQG